MARGCVISGSGSLALAVGKHTLAVRAKAIQGEGLIDIARLVLHRAP